VLLPAQHRPQSTANKSVDGGERGPVSMLEVDRLPQLNRTLVHDLASGRYLGERAPILIVGPPAAPVAERYETTSTIVTSNLDLPEWDQAFPANRLLASATLDRLRHNAYCLVLDGTSYRAPKKLPATIKLRLANASKSTHS
jgi:hypothetical protein